MKGTIRGTGRACSLQAGLIIIPQLARRNSSLVTATKSAATCPTDIGISRRSALLKSAGMGLGACLSLLPAQPVQAAGVADLARGFLRPELTPIDAVVILMDAKSTLKEIAVRSWWVCMQWNDGCMQHATQPGR